MNDRCSDNAFSNGGGHVATDALQKAIKGCGGYAAVARLFETSRQVVWNWAHKRVPAERVLKLEEVTGVSRHTLRPDLYPPENNNSEMQAAE